MIPVITSVLAVNATQSAPFSYQILATNSPVGFTAANLPYGVGLNPNTGMISGVPQVSGTYNVAISANNADGVGIATLVITIGSGSNNIVAGPAHQDFWQNHDFPSVS